jgi:hypothetical protein
MAFLPVDDEGQHVNDEGKKEAKGKSVPDEGFNLSMSWCKNSIVERNVSYSDSTTITAAGSHPNSMGSDIMVVARH